MTDKIVDIMGRLKAMHIKGVDLSFEVSMSDTGGLFYEGKVHYMVGIQKDDDLDISYATKSMEFGNHEHPEAVLVEMEEFIKTLNITTGETDKQEKESKTSYYRGIPTDDVDWSNKKNIK